MGLSKYQIARAVHLAASRPIGEIAQELGLTYKETHKVLSDNGVIITRGRKRGGGKVIVPSGRVDRRTRWAMEKIKAGLCSQCGKKNNSGSRYHCDDCLRKRSEAKNK